MKSDLVVDTFGVEGLKVALTATTFKVKAMSGYLQENLKQLYQFIEEEKLSQ